MSKNKITTDHAELNCWMKLTNSLNNSLNIRSEIWRWSLNAKVSRYTIFGMDYLNYFNNAQTQFMPLAFFNTLGIPFGILWLTERWYWLIEGRINQQWAKPGLTHFKPLIFFYTPWKHHKISGFLMFSGGVERDQQHEMD